MQGDKNSVESGVGQIAQGAAAGIEKMSLHATAAQRFINAFARTQRYLALCGATTVEHAYPAQIGRSHAPSPTSPARPTTSAGTPLTEPAPMTTTTSSARIN